MLVGHFQAVGVAQLGVEQDEPFDVRGAVGALDADHLVLTVRGQRRAHAIVAADVRVDAGRSRVERVDCGSDSDWRHRAKQLELSDRVLISL